MEYQLKLEFYRPPNEELHPILQCPECFAIRKKVDKPVDGYRPHLNANPRLRIPYRISRNSVCPQLTVIFSQARKASVVQGEPTSTKRMDLHWNRKVIRKNTLQRAGRMRTLCDETRISEQRMIRKGKSVTQPAGSHSNQIKQVLGENVASTLLVTRGILFIGDEKAVLFPRPIEER